MEPNSGVSPGRAPEKSLRQQERPFTAQASLSSCSFATAAIFSIQLFVSVTLAVVFVARDTAVSAGGFAYRRVRGIVSTCTARIRAALEAHVPIIRPPHASGDPPFSLNGSFSNNSNRKRTNCRRMTANCPSNDGVAITEAANDATSSQLQSQQKASPRESSLPGHRIDEATNGFSNDGDGTGSSGTVSRVKGGSDSEGNGNSGDGDGDSMRNSQSAINNIGSKDFDTREAKAALLPTKVHAIGSRYSSFARTLRFWGGRGGSGGSNSRGISSSSSSSVDSDSSGSSQSPDGTPTGGDNETARAVRLQTTPSRSRLPNIGASKRHHDSKHHTGGTHSSSSSSSSTYNHGSRSGNSSVGSSSNIGGRTGDLSSEVHNLPVAAGDSTNRKHHAHSSNAQYSSSVVDLSPLGSPLLRTPYARSPTLSPPSQPFCSPALSPLPLPTCHPTTTAASSCTKTSSTSSSSSSSSSSSGVANPPTHYVAKTPTPAPTAKPVRSSMSSSPSSAVRAAAAWATSSSSSLTGSSRRPKSTTCTIEEGDEEAEVTPPNSVPVDPSTARETRPAATTAAPTVASTTATATPTTDRSDTKSDGNGEITSQHDTGTNAAGSKHNKKTGSNNKKASKSKSRRNALHA